MPPDTDVQTLREVSAAPRDAYPAERQQRGGVARVSLSEAEPTLDELGAWTRGYMFLSADEFHRIQFRRDGFTELPPDVPQELASFLWRWVVRDDQTGIRCNLSQASQPVVDAQTVGIVVDIDCYVSESLEPRDERVFDRLGQLRDMKNRIFFGSLTPRALEMFR